MNVMSASKVKRSSYFDLGNSCSRINLMSSKIENNQNLFKESFCYLSKLILENNENICI